MKVLIDTNFFLIPLQFNIDIFSELERIMSAEGKYELSTISPVLTELGARGPPGEKAGELIKLNKVKIYEFKATDTDSGLVEFAEAGDFLCTQDKELKRLARAKGIRIITMVSQNHLEEV